QLATRQHGQCVFRPRTRRARGLSQAREMVPGIYLFLAHALSRQDGRACGVWRGWGLLQVVVERFQGVSHLRVAEEPREELGVALGELDGEARSDACAWSGAARSGSSAGGRLYVSAGGAEPDDVYIREDCLAYDLRRTDLRPTSRNDAKAGRGDHGYVVADSDVTGDALLLTGGDGHGHVAAGERQICGRGSGEDLSGVSREHVRGDQ